MNLLEMDDVTSAYGDCQVLFGMSLRIAPGEVVTLVGRNGMGKTTTVRSLMGLTPIRGGSITLGGEAIVGWRPERVAAAGIALVPEGRHIFPNLTVDENLRAFARTGAWTVDKVMDQFPALGRRRSNLGNQLSGGEQQMLALGRALLRNGRLLVIDEATEGLAPLIRQEIWSCLQRLKADGMAMLLIDKYLEPLLQIGDRHHAIDRGTIAWSGSSEALRSATDVWERYVGV
jgi:branched-chain amino acid transport system ATP-binding protein